MNNAMHISYLGIQNSDQVHIGLRSPHATITSAMCLTNDGY